MKTIREISNDEQMEAHRRFFNQEWQQFIIKYPEYSTVPNQLRAWRMYLAGHELWHELAKVSDDE